MPKVNKMEKVRCENCGSIGYTASPDSVRCSNCGGRHQVIVTLNKDHNPIKEENTCYLKPWMGADADAYPHWFRRNNGIIT